MRFMALGVRGTEIGIVANKIQQWLDQAPLKRPVSESLIFTAPKGYAAIVIAEVLDEDTGIEDRPDRRHFLDGTS